MKARNQTNSDFIKKRSQELGFHFCGIAKADFLHEEANQFEQWLKKGYQGQMKYLENNIDARLDPTRLVYGAKSVISLIYNYYPKQDITTPSKLKIAKYAYGEDYHRVIREKLKTLLHTIRQKIGHIEGRIFVDSAPVHERAWARRSGLGWVGKNSLLLNRNMGSFFFLSTIILDAELAYDDPSVDDYCGTCTACIDACPTEAIPQPGVVNGSRCISYYTIELKDEIPSSALDKIEDWIFGCDLCQDVCPWNRFAKPHDEKRFAPLKGLLDMKVSDWMSLTEDDFQEKFSKSPLKRAGLNKLVQTIRLLIRSNKKNKLP